MLDIDLGHALLVALLAFVGLPVLLALVVTGAIVWLVRTTTRRLAIGVYVMLASALITPAPIVWGDNHLGFTSSQVLEGYGALAWAVGAAVALAGLAGVLQHRQRLALTAGLVLGAIVLGGWVLSGAVAALLWSTTSSGSGCAAADCGGPPAGVQQAVGLALIPLLGTIEVVLAYGWLAVRLGPTLDWRWAGVAGVVAAALLGASVYVRGPDAFASSTHGLELALLAWVLVLALARVTTPAPRPGGRHVPCV